MKPKHPSEEGLRDLVHDTPVKPLTPLDERMARYLGDQDSMPPPPLALEARRDQVLSKIRAKTESGSFDAEALLGANQAWFERVLAQRIGEERASHQKERADKAEAELERAQEKLEADRAERRRFWSVILAGIIIGVVVALIGWIAIVLVAASHR